MEYAFSQILPDLSTPVLVAIEALREAAAPPLTDPDAPVRWADLPTAWHATLLDRAQDFAMLVPPGYAEIARTDWELLLPLLARRLEAAYRLAGLLAQAERGPSPEDLDGAPVLSPWSPAVAWYGYLVLAGHVTGHPRLGEAWIHTSILVGIDVQGGWARSHARWYRLGEPMGEEHRLDYWLARVPVRLIETDDAQVARHFAALRERVGRLLEPLDESHAGGRR